METRKLGALFFPEGVLLGTLVALVHWGAPGGAEAPAVRAYPAIVLIVGASLAWRFGRGRVLLALISLAMAAAALRWLVPLDTATPFITPATAGVVASALAATLAVLAWVDERRPFTTAWFRRLGMLALPGLGVTAAWLLSEIYPEAAARVLGAAPLPPPVLDWMRIGQPAAILATIATGALVARALWRPDAESRGLLWAAVGGVAAMAASPAGGRSTLYLANAGLVLVVATVESAYAMAYRDQLTGLPGRRAFDDALRQVEATYTIAMVDVDHFKRFNDTHGHDAGDQVLRMVAERLGRVGGGGRAYRYGGEEFAVVFTGNTADESEPHLEALREAIASATFRLRGPGRPRRKPKSPRTRKGKPRELAVTVSIGVAESGATGVPDQVLKAADRALYRAKEEGRNRVER